MAMRGGHGRHGGHGRPGGRMPHPFPMFGYGGMMGIGWIAAPFMGIMFIMMFLGSMISSVTTFTTVLGLLYMVGAIYILYQMRSKDKNKRKRKTHSDDYYNDAYDDAIR